MKTKKPSPCPVCGKIPENHLRDVKKNVVCYTSGCPLAGMVYLPDDWEAMVKRSPRHKKAPDRRFLVLGRSNLDDVPMGLFATKPEAVKFASRVTLEKFSQCSRVVCGCESVLLNVGVVEFKNSAPLPYFEVKSFKEDAA